MTAKNAILLIIKQNQGIEYNRLLNRIAANYSSVNSARAALSRALKDLSAFGFVVKRYNNLFVTEKATSQINAEMKNKLLLKLNQAVNSKNNYLAIDSIVEHLHTLIERSKEDKDLLKAAKGGADFYISDLLDVDKKIKSQVKHLNYITNAFEGQIESLKKLDFNDVRKESFNKSTINLIKKTGKKLKAADFLIQSGNQELLKELGNKFNAKPKGNNLLLPTSSLPNFMNSINSEMGLHQPILINLYIGSIRIRIQDSSIYFIGPYSVLNKLLC